MLGRMLCAQPMMVQDVQLEEIIAPGINILFGLVRINNVEKQEQRIYHRKWDPLFRGQALERIKEIALPKIGAITKDEAMQVLDFLGTFSMTGNRGRT